MMEKGQKMIPCGGKHANGTPKQTKSYNCKVCGKEGYFTLIRDHIEHNHIEGISIPCGLCDKTFSSRMALSYHKYRSHKWIKPQRFCNPKPILSMAMTQHLFADCFLIRTIKTNVLICDFQHPNWESFRRVQIDCTGFASAAEKCK